MAGLKVVIVFIAISLSQQSQLPQDLPEDASEGSPEGSPVAPSKWRPVPESKSKMGVYKKAAVASDGGPCSLQGAEVMKDEGGSVVDSAIVTLLCNGLENLHSMGIGGGFFMTIYNGMTKESYIVDAREIAPIKASKDMYEGNYEGSLLGALASAVPGEIQGYWMAHQRFGRLPWKSLFRRAISMARNGWKLSKAAAKALEKKVAQDEKQLESLRPILYDAVRRRWKRAGETVKNEKLGLTLEKIAKLGAKEFYEGKLAEDISQEILDHGGIITKEDLRQLRRESSVLKREPLVYSMRNGWSVIGPPPPSSAVVLDFIVNILESLYPVHPQRKILRSRKKTLKLLHRYVEAMKFGYAKRTFLGDESFIDTKALVKNLTSHEYGDDIADLVTDNATHPTNYYGPASFFDTHGTSHNSFLSPEGDAVAVTSTINAYFGAKFMGPKTGILYNNEMNDFSIPGHDDDYGIPPSPYNWIEPGKKPMSSMAPIIIVDRRGRVRMVVGGSGGSKITTAVASVIRNHLWLGQNIKESIDMSRIHHQLIPREVEAEGWFPKDLLDSLHSEFGHNTTINARRMAIVQGITVDQSGVVRANCDFRKGGFPAGF